MSDTVRVKEFTNKQGVCSRNFETCDDCPYEDTERCDFTELEVTDECSNKTE